MPQTLQSFVDNLLMRVMRFWIKPEVLPEDPTSLINPEFPVLYVLEVGGLADKAALTIAAERLSLPHPDNELLFGGTRFKTSVDVLRQRHNLFFRKRRSTTSELLTSLVKASKNSDAGELQIVPVSVYWGRAPDKESSIVKLLLSENWQFAGRTRKLLTTLVHGRHTLLSISEPLSLYALQRSGGNSDLLPRKVSRILRVHFRQRRIASLGPDQSHRRMLMDHVLSDSGVRLAINNEAGTSNADGSRQQARKYANEISADVSYPTIRVLHTLLKRLWNELYDGVEVNGIDQLKAVADGREVVYVPCHRSHIDYMLLSYILYVQGFSLPHIAAGINLNLPFVGGILRRGGAFFLRRSFAGKPLYSAVFNAYMKELLQRGHALAYFIEGGRSRSGRLLPHKGGMLSMTVHAYLHQPKTPVVFVPVYFGYERLLEGRSFTSELAGGKKQRESVFALLKSVRTLKEDYGRVYVNFGAPIELDSLLEQHEPQWRSYAIDSERPAWIRPVVDDLGATIMQRINEATSVTPISLLATAMLATPRGCISCDEFIQQVTIFKKLLQGTYQKSRITVPEIDAQELIAHGSRLGFVHTIEDAVGPMVTLKPGQAAPLNYFRNNILHLLTLPALVACTFTNKRHRSEQEIAHLVELSFPYIQGELFLSTEVYQESLQQVLTGLEQSGLVTNDNNVWARPTAGSLEAVALFRLAKVITPALERDYLCTCLLAQCTHNEIDSEELQKRCQLAADRLASTHGKVATELYDKHLHNSFIESMQRRGYIELNDDKLRPTNMLLKIEDEARSLLPEPSRHSILAISLAISQKPSP